MSAQRESYLVKTARSVPGETNALAHFYALLIFVRVIQRLLDQQVVRSIAICSKTLIQG